MVKIGVSLKSGRQRDIYSLDEVAGRIMEAKSAILIYKRDKELRGTMTEQDTIKLLCECDAGTQMGVASLDEVLDYVSNKEFKQYLLDCKEDHQKVKEEIRSLLAEHHHEGKAPGPMAKSMSWLKTNVKLVLNESDETIADLMTDGCNMGIKSLNKYLNQYKAADEKSRAMAIRLIGLEEGLVKDIRVFL